MRAAIYCRVSTEDQAKHGYSLPAQVAAMQSNQPAGTAPASQLPAYLQHAGIDQNLNHLLPLNAEFTNGAGAVEPLGHYFSHRPVVMALVYYHCGLLCPQVLHGMADALKQTGYTPGKDYEVVVASIDPMDTSADALESKQQFLQWMGLPAQQAGIHFLTGPQSSIDALTSAAGFHYVRVPGPDGKMTQFAHSSVIFIVTPGGRLSKYLSGISYQPRDVRLSLIDASGEKIGSFSDLVLMYCCNYSPSTGKYTVSILRVLSIAGLFTVFAIIGMIFLLTRKPAGMQPTR